MQYHPRLRQRERDEDADHVQRDERMRVAAEGDQEDAGEGAQADDSVRKRQTVALVHELPRYVAVARENRCEPREVGVRRVRREHQDEHRRRLHGIVRGTAIAEDAARELRHDGLPLARQDVVRLRKQRDAEKHRDRQRRHHQHRRRGVLCLRRPERRHAVRYRLHASHRRAPIGEGSQDEEHRQRRAVRSNGVRRHDRLNVTRDDAPDADADQPERRHDEEIGRNREDVAGLADTPQVADHQHHDESERQLDAVHVPLRKRRGDRGDAGRDADRNGQDVVDEKRCRGDQRR